MRARDDRVGLNVWAPAVNLLRDPRWGRNEEGYSEDPWLTSAIATAYTRGLRGDHPHVLAHRPGPQALAGVQQRDRPRHHLRPRPPRVLHEYDLRAFRDAVEAGAVAGVMPAYNLVNGRPNHVSPVPGASSCAPGPTRTCWSARTRARPPTWSTPSTTSTPTRRRRRLAARRRRQLHRPRHGQLDDRSAASGAPWTQGLLDRGRHRRGGPPPALGPLPPRRVRPASSTRTRTPRTSTPRPTGRWPGRPPSRRSSCSRTTALLPLAGRHPDRRGRPARRRVQARLVQRHPHPPLDPARGPVRALRRRARGRSPRAWTAYGCRTVRRRVPARPRGGRGRRRGTRRRGRARPGAPRRPHRPAAAHRATPTAPSWRWSTGARACWRCAPPTAATSRSPTTARARLRRPARRLGRPGDLPPGALRSPRRTVTSCGTSARAGTSLSPPTA